MPTKQELLERIDVRELPATRVPETSISGQPETVSPGDLVVIYSRGATRLAKVLTSTDKRAAVAYTTETAWKEGRDRMVTAAAQTDEEIEARYAYMAEYDHLRDRQADRIADSKKYRELAKAGDPNGFVTVTTKYVKRDEIWSHA